MKSQYKTKQVGIRLSPGEFKEIERRANARNMTVTDHVRDLIRRDLDEAKKAA